MLGVDVGVGSSTISEWTSVVKIFRTVSEWPGVFQGNTVYTSHVLSETVGH